MTDISRDEKYFPKFVKDQFSPYYDLIYSRVILTSPGLMVCS